MKKKLFLIALLFSVVLTFSQEKDFASPTGIEMVFVHGGTFRMGSNADGRDEKPVHEVRLSSFYIGKYEVTQREYQAVMGTNPSHFKGDNLPVEQVSWYDAIEFCNKLSIKEGLSPVYTINKNRRDPNNNCSYDDLKWTVTADWSADGYRLPTEAEREFAARGGVPAQNAGTFNDLWAGTDVEAELVDYAWYIANAGHDLPGGSDHPDFGTHPAGTKHPNELGLYDMSGNVREWCWDWHGSYTGGSKTNPKGASSGSFRVSRGGHWTSSDAAYCTVFFRGFFYDINRGGYTSGLRVIRRIP